ncbi:hypothetical protein TVAG_355850 [Trichomonas vaginalis G3]|uniref:Uncharacterized protein n=1 Tax=Trichomonas vaginalis (strain ATCC PRA-98 / G3) TaxID=412133 RepID=A2G0J3_TRIV3|nr:hypothetical protein TVAGG3_0056890 [Trichomonas vaginalis G3]EAX89331.1 hypothetical protein TVAG_355850 [Trichomonas vaginalis G3]KAI5541706.1 hypothetical protein TVAGG3_0056890 [Trichomonas vaginalis G3]|eukprot:XP_001302261.1 hypothetical protein [Trichomonas vaginalis G3]
MINPIPWKCPPKFVGLYGMTNSKYYKILECIKNLDDTKNLENTNFFCNEISSKINYENLIDEISDQEPSTIQVFAELILQKIEYVIPNIQNGAMMSIIESKALNSVSKFTESLKIGFLLFKISKIDTISDIVNIANEATKYIINSETSISIQFCKSFFRKLYSILDNDKTLHNEKISVVSRNYVILVRYTNTLISKIIKEKPQIFADDELNGILWSFLERLDLIAPSPFFFVDHPENCTLTAAITLSIIIGEIIASIETGEDFAKTIIAFHSYCPVQTRDCLWYYAQEHSQIVYDEIENSQSLIDIFCENRIDVDLFNTPFFIKSVQGEAKSFYEFPDPDVMERLLVRRIDYERVISFGLVNDSLLVNEDIIFAILTEGIAGIKIDMGNMNINGMLLKFETVLNCVELISRYSGYNEKNVQKFVQIVDLYLISPLYNPNSNAVTYPEARIRKLLDYHVQLMKQSPNIFIYYAFTNQNHLSSVFFISYLYENLHPEDSLNIVKLFVTANMKQAWISLHLSTEMAKNVASFSKDSRFCFVILRCLVDAFLMNADDLASGCYILRLFSKLVSCKEFSEEFNSNKMFLALLDATKEYNHEEYNYLVRKIKKRFF